jgi:hypothetical protein
MHKNTPKELYNEKKLTFNEMPLKLKRMIKKYKDIDLLMKDSIEGEHWAQLADGACMWCPDFVYRVRPNHSHYEHNVTKTLLAMTQEEIRKCVLLTRKLAKLFPEDDNANRGTVTDRLEYMTNKMVEEIVELQNRVYDLNKDSKELEQRLGKE